MLGSHRSSLAEIAPTSVGIDPLMLAGTDLLVVGFAFVTLLGDAWFLLAGLSLCYWFGPRLDESARPAAATAVGFATLALAVVLAIKSFTAIPRPPAVPTNPAELPALVGPFVAGEIDSSGFSFPSGHATGSTAVYGALGVLLAVGRRRRRYLLAGTVIVLVSFSRVVLQVHYLRDILAGMALGGVLLLVGLRVARGDDPLRPAHLRPDRVFLLAGVAALAGFGIALWAGHPDEIRQGAIGVGTAVGGVLTWRRFGDRLPAAPSVPPLWAAVGLLVAGGLWVAAYVGVFPLVGAALASAGGVAITLGLPLLARR
jgi:membrane-associated phospholipid phosphatase